MAVHSNNPNTNNTTAASAASTHAGANQFQRTPDTTQTETVRPSMGFGLATAMAGVGTGGDVYERLFQKLAEKIKSTNEQGSGTYTLTRLLKNQHGLHYSGIIVSQKRDDRAVGHVLMIERTGDYPQNAVQTIDGNRFEIIRTPADALDPKYIEQTKQLTASVHRIPPSSVVVADGTLVPNEFDVDNDALVAELLDNAASAVKMELETQATGYTGMNLAHYTAANPRGKFTVDLHFNNEDTVYYDQTGMPVRQDVAVVLSFRNTVGNSATQSINQGNDLIEICRTYGYIDFEFTGAPMMNNVPVSQKFMPNFIITHIQAGPGVIPTPDILMMAVASVVSLNENGNWMQSFRVTPARKGEVDLKDVGALNIEGNLTNDPSGYGPMYDTKKATTNITEIHHLLRLLTRQEMAISIDIPKAGPESWYMSMFRAAANNDKGATARLAKFMNTASNGGFDLSQHVIFSSINNAIHGGLYREKSHEKGRTERLLDLRNLSCYLAVANHVHATGQDRAILTQYTNTLYNTAIDPILRASKRREYLADMSNGSMVVKQMFDRHTFNGNFIRSWTQALAKADFKPAYTHNNNVADMFAKRNAANFQDAALGQDVRVMGAGTDMSSVGAYGLYTRQYY